MKQIAIVGAVIVAVIVAIGVQYANAENNIIVHAPFPPSQYALEERTFYAVEETVIGHHTLISKTCGTGYTDATLLSFGVQYRGIQPEFKYVEYENEVRVLIPPMDESTTVKLKIVCTSKYI